VAIKNRDGSTFRLNQPIFETTPIAVHNFNFPESITKAKPPEELIPEEPVKEEFIELEDVEVEEIEVPIKEVDPSKIIMKSKKKASYCLPAVSNNPLIFGQQFSLQADYLKMGDIFAQLWITDDRVKEGSILFKEKRWWRVGQVEDKDNGFVINVAPSEITPSFQV
jgi:hypothetical protein